MAYKTVTFPDDSKIIKSVIGVGVMMFKIKSLRYTLINFLSIQYMLVIPPMV